MNSPLTRQIFFFGITAAILLTITFLSTKDSQAMLTPWEVEWGVKHSKIIAIGIVQSVETKLVDESFTISGGYHEQWLPYQYVTLKVEKYILDKTRQHSDTIIFRDRAEGEGILDGKTVYSNEDPVGRYEIGERSLFFITESKEELFSGGFQNKFDFVNEDRVQSKYFETDEREPISLSKLEEEITETIIASSPREQTASGFFPEDVRCKGGLQLIFKSKDNSPACVKLETAKRLVERGWGSMILKPIQKPEIKTNSDQLQETLTFLPLHNVGTCGGVDCPWFVNYGKCGRGVWQNEDGKPLSGKAFSKSKTGNVILDFHNCKENAPKSMKVTNSEFIVHYYITGGNLLEAKVDLNAKSMLLLLNSTGNGTLTITMPVGLVDSYSKTENNELFVLVDGEEVNFEDQYIAPIHRTLKINFQAGAKEIEIFGTMALG